MRNFNLKCFIRICSFFWITFYPLKEISSTEIKQGFPSPPLQKKFTTEYYNNLSTVRFNGVRDGERIFANPYEHVGCESQYVELPYIGEITLFLSAPSLFIKHVPEFCDENAKWTLCEHFSTTEDRLCYCNKEAFMLCMYSSYKPIYKQESFSEYRTWLFIYGSFKNLTNELFSINSNNNFQYLSIESAFREQIQPLAFQSFAKLQYLTLADDEITELQNDTFKGLTQLRGLVLSKNEIEAIAESSFKHLDNLILLYLNWNSIKMIANSTFADLKKLEILALTGNQITELHPNGTFYGLENLIMLHLAENQIQALEENTFTGLGRLQSLILNKNKITEIKKGSLNGLTSLIELELENNQIDEIEEGSFKNLKTLTYLNLKFNSLKTIGPNVVNNFLNVTLVTDNFQICCSVENYDQYVYECYTDIDQFSSCTDLISDKLLEYLIWILSAISIVANCIVVAFRIINMTTNEKHSYLIISLAISDSLMGIYLLIIAFKNWEYHGSYSSESYAWRSSNMCQFAGFLCTLSCETTVFLLTIITIDRLIVIKNPFGNRQINTSKIVALIALCWITAAIIATLPLSQVGIKYFEDVKLTYYGRSGVCLPLHLSTYKPQGYKYSIFVYIVLNAISFITIAISYVNMYWEVKKTRSAVRQSESAQEKSMAFRMTLLVLSDAACWTPVIILGIITLSNFNLPPQVYPWMAVIVLPTNAALNPILYTLSSIPAIRNIGSRMRNIIGNAIRSVSSTSERTVTSYDLN